MFHVCICLYRSGYKSTMLGKPAKSGLDNWAIYVNDVSHIKEF